MRIVDTTANHPVPDCQSKEIESVTVGQLMNPKTSHYFFLDQTKCFLRLQSEFLRKASSDRIELQTAVPSRVGLPDPAGDDFVDQFLWRGRRFPKFDESSQQGACVEKDLHQGHRSLSCLTTSEISIGVRSSALTVGRATSRLLRRTSFGLDTARRRQIEKS
jgi:hypothetical protein